jgi:iron complex transport system ATP-binding protein
MIRAADLHCGYGPKGPEVLRGVSLRVERGEMAALLGPNGSGKTTLLSALAGTLRPRSGRVELAGRDAAGLRPRERARLAAAVPQRAESAFPLSCLSVVLMGRYAHLGLLGAYGPEDLAAAERAMVRTGCLHLRERPVDAVSGGEFQRVLLARALTQDTDILLLDEPTASLDVAATLDVLDLLRARAESGGAVLLALHDLNLAALYCGRLIFLQGGAVACAGATEDVFNEQTLASIYGADVRVAPHPVTGAPQAHFVPRGATGPGHAAGAAAPGLRMAGGSSARPGF